MYYLLILILILMNNPQRRTTVRQNPMWGTTRMGRAISHYGRRLRALLNVSDVLNNVISPGKEFHAGMVETIVDLMSGVFLALGILSLWLMISPSAVNNEPV